MFSGLLDWAVVAIPLLAGLMAWFLPIERPTRTNRIGLVVACGVFSLMIWGQQHLARVSHAREMANLPTKQDIQKLPTASDIVRELTNLLPAPAPQLSWDMTDAQLLSLSQRLAQNVPDREQPDLVSCVVGNEDSTRFAKRLVAAFRAAGWKLPGNGFSQVLYAGFPTGIIIKLHSPEDHVVGLEQFVFGLRDAGIDPTFGFQELVPAGEFQFVVGAKR